jgi:hypothetical protein
MVKQLYPSKRVETVTITNQRAVALWLCPVCLKPHARQDNLVRHLTAFHKLPAKEVATHMHELISVPAQKTTVLRFADPRPRRRRLAHQELEDSPAVEVASG